MRRLSMKNKRRKSESASNSESEENGGARTAIDNAGNGETQAGRNNNLSATRKSASKRRSLRGAPVHKSSAHADDSVETDDSTLEPEKERENGEKSAAATPQRSSQSPNKRRRKEDQKASTSARDADQSDVENEYEVCDAAALSNVNTPVTVD